MLKKALLIEEINSSYKSSEHEQTQDVCESAPRKTLFKIKKGKCIVCKKLCSYKCPKCSKNYCNIEHFRSHNLFCSEQFFEKQVKQTLKGLKVTDKKQKKKVIQMVNNFREELEDDYLAGQITPQRLEELLKEIESGKQPQLSKKQEQSFQQFLNQLNLQAQAQSDKPDEKKQNQQQCLQLQKTFWEDEEGLSLYLQQNIEIQDYAESENPELIAQRSLYKKQLDQFTALHPYSQSFIKPVINMHLVQIIFAYILLHRVFDGELEEFRKIFITAYCSKENQVLLKSEQVEIKDLINQIYIQLLRNQSDKSAQAIVKLWMEEYWQILITDLRKIFSNLLLVMETLLRIIELANAREKKYEQVVGNPTQGDKNLSKQEKKLIKMQTKVAKKSEYLLYFVKYRYNKQYCFANLTQLDNYIGKKNEKRGSQEIVVNKGS